MARLDRNMGEAVHSLDVFLDEETKVIRTQKQWFWHGAGCTYRGLLQAWQGCGEGNGLLRVEQ